MNKVYSFRLSTDNRQETEALIVIQRWLKQGYSLRLIITKAILLLDSPISLRDEQITLSEISQQLKFLLEYFQGTVLNEPMIDASPTKELTTEFLISLRKTMKSGLRSVY